MEYQSSYTDSLRADILPSYSDSLIHYGVLGMKWGVRRYQNKDGTYTAQGKKHRQQGFRLSANQKKALGVAAGVTVAAAGAYIASNPKVRKLAYDMMYKNSDKTVNDILNENGKIKYRDVGEAYVNEILLRDPLQSGTDSVTGKRKPFMALPAKGETSPDESAQRKLEHLKYDRDEAIDDYNNYLNNVVENTEIKRKRNSYDARRRRMDTLEQRRQDARQSVKEYEDYKKSLGHDDIYGNYLMHHGIKGQKWGVRRYQNRDGSYTKSGLLRRHLQAKQMQMRMNHVDRVYINDKQRLKDRTRKMRDSVSKLSKKQDRSRWDNIVLDEHKRWLKLTKNEPQKRKRRYDRQIRKMISEANKQGFDVHSKAGKRWVQKQKFNGVMNEVVDFTLPVLNYGRNRGTKYKVTPRKN